MRSIRNDLLVALLGAILVVMLLGGWATYRAARDEAGSIFDYQLQQIAMSLRDRTFFGSAEALAGDDSLDYVIRIWDRNGLSIYYSRPRQVLPTLTRLGFSTAETLEGEWRIFAIQYQGLTISVAQPMRVRQRLAADAAWRTLKPFVILLPVLGALIWFLVARGLRPLAQIAKAVEARTPDLLEPLRDPDVPEEVRPLVSSLNDLLARLKIALDSQRAFVADAAHELRTPLTALQLQTQLVERAVSEEERCVALNELKSGLQRASHAVQQLLTLARQEPGAAGFRFETVGLADLSRQVVTAHQRLAEERGIDLGLARFDETAQVRGDAEALRILLSNLVGNAVRYTPVGGQVDVSCGLTEAGPFLDVVDNGPGIPAAERERVFDRFYRRGEDVNIRTGAGLGLSIVRTIAQRHGAQVVLDDAPGGGLLARVVFSPMS